MKRSVSQNRDLHGNVPDHSSAALVLVDVLNDLDFPEENAFVSVAGTLASGAGLNNSNQASACVSVHPDAHF